ncbi:methylglyoxal reductase DkgA-like [Rhynchophorus ferrugineus]|uniref:NADP-dependent oxidoreductase domain-containing protein n=1 Tax=Rhynchophorus ferrugineus TaxID=354439 RepID=A0A834HR15_RHYFE|nr:hypothetical protein GWI33_021104 [Rhynchophorus ferrugineus]
MSPQKLFKLHSGDNVPLLGFGTYLVDGYEKTRDVLDRALTTGYRLFDTAKMYQNETDIGRALQVLLPKHNLSRKDVFITTKLYPSDHGERAYGAIEESLKKLDCEYIDLYLIHWPGVFGHSSSSKVPKLRAESWKHMVKAVDDGLVKNIGVSNYTVRHLNQLIDNSYGIIPAVNQIEWHPYYHPSDVLEFCKQKNILLQAYMPLGSGNQGLLNDATISNIAKKLGKTNAQVILKWSIQQGVSVIPKAASKSHIQDNFQLDFSIPDDDMTVLSNLKKYVKFDWDPETVP